MNEIYLAYAVLCVACLIAIAALFVNPFKLRSDLLGVTVFAIQVFVASIVLIAPLCVIGWALSVVMK